MCYLHYIRLLIFCGSRQICFWVFLVQYESFNILSCWPVLEGIVVPHPRPLPGKPFTPSGRTWESPDTKAKRHGFSGERLQPPEHPPLWWPVPVYSGAADSLGGTALRVMCDAFNLGPSNERARHARERGGARWRRQVQINGTTLVKVSL